MVTDAVIGMLTNLVNWLLSFLPVITLPSWADSTVAAIGTVFGYAGSLGAWVSMPLVGVVLSFVLAAWGVAVVIKFVRIVASFATLGGGSAA